ncbi:MAG: DUF4430 domain-containing protein [Bacillota bacterium]|jgi:hypothetical protein
MKRKYGLILLILCLALGLCLCGCGKVSTSQAQQYLDGENDVSAEETETAAADTESAAEPAANSAETTDTAADTAADTSNGSAAAAAAGTAAGSAGSGGTSSGSSGGSGSSSVSGNGSSGGGASSGGSGGSSSSSGGGSQSSTSSAPQCTIAIDCKTILSNPEKLKSEKKSYVPSDGVILKTTTVTFKDGDTVFDVLKKVTRDNGIHLEFKSAPAYGGSYVNGIANLYEFDCGNESGWEYCVNDWYPNYACDNYKLENGDVIKWRYTCATGRDL